MRIGKHVVQVAPKQVAVAKPAERKFKKAARQVSGPDKQLVERKRKADAALDDLAARPSGALTSTFCLVMSHKEVLLPEKHLTTDVLQIIRPVVKPVLLCCLFNCHRAAGCSVAHITACSLKTATSWCLLTPDVVMAAGKQQQGNAKKAQPAKAEKGDKLDVMVANYKAKYFGGQTQTGQTGTKQASKQPAAGISRWFE